MSRNLSSSAIYVASAATTTVLLLLSTWFWKSTQEKKSSSLSKKKCWKWIKIGHVKSLISYPIKSCQGILVEKAVLTGLGLQCPQSHIRDRDFLLIDSTGKQVTMGHQPKMSLVSVTVASDGESLVLDAPNMPSILLKRPQPTETNQRTCAVRQDTAVKALDCGDDVALWFQQFLETDSLRVVYHHLNYTQRSFEPYQVKCPEFVKSDFGSFHNGSSYMMMNEGSVTELNKYLPPGQTPSTWKNFRPNILLESGECEPFEEMNLRYVKIGRGDGDEDKQENRILHGAAPCQRCPITTVDQSQGILPKGEGEPLKTLRNLKWINAKVAEESVRELFWSRGLMGIRLGLYDDGEHSHFNQNREGATISVGDPVYAALL